jgi:hypothetical protein
MSAEDRLFATMIPYSITTSFLLPSLLALILLVGWAVRGHLALPSQDILEWALQCILLGVTAISWIGVVLATLGLFRPWLLVLLLALLGIWRWLAARRGTARCSPSPHTTLTQTPWPAQVLVVLLLLGAGWLYARPAETFNLSDDSAVYTIGGIVLAREGSLFHEPTPIYDLASLSPLDLSQEQMVPTYEAQSSFVQQFSFTEMVASSWSRHLGPFYQWALDNGRIEIGFLPFSKVWAALIVWLWGSASAIWAAPLFGLLGLLSLYGLVRRAVGWAPAIAAIVCLGVSLPQVWYARYMLSEVFAQTIILGGLYLVTVARQERQSGSASADGLAAIGAALLALLTTLRLEALVMILPLALLLWILWHGRAEPGDAVRTSWLWTLVGGVLLGTALSFTVAPLYLATRGVNLLAVPMIRRAVILGALGVGLGVGTRHIEMRRLRTGLDVLAPHAPMLVAAGWLLWAIYGGVRVLSTGLGATFPCWLIQYLGVAAVALGVMGSVGLSLTNRVEKHAAELMALLGLGALLALLYTVQALVMPVHPWAIRRAVPVILPALAAGAGWSLTSGLALAIESLDHLSIQWQRALSIGLSCAATLAVTISLANATMPLATYAERRGLYDQLAAVASSLPDNAMLLFGQSPTGDRLTQPMEMIFGLPSFVLQDSGAVQSDSPVTEHLVRSAMRQGRPVYYVLTDGNATWRPRHWRFESAGAWRLSMPVLRYALGRPPNTDDVAEATWILDLYRVLPKTEVGFWGDVTRVEAGVGSAPYLYLGFYGWEIDNEGIPFRWTTGDAVVTIPWLQWMSKSYGDLCLLLDISAWRPGAVPDGRLIVEVEGMRFYDAPLDRERGRYTVAIPVRAIDNVRLDDLEIRLHSDSWDLGQISGPANARRLGFMFYGLEIRDLDACPVDP